MALWLKRRDQVKPEDRLLELTERYEVVLVNGGFARRSSSPFRS